MIGTLPEENRYLNNYIHVQHQLSGKILRTVFAVYQVFFLASEMVLLLEKAKAVLLRIINGTLYTQ
jgi:hypothetical protein